MRKVQKSILALGVITVFICEAIFLPRPISAGDLEPSGPVAPTMHTLRDIYDRLGSCVGAAVEKTGQSVQYRVHDDGDLQKGVASPSHRWTVNSDGTVRDNLTGLIWLRDAICGGWKNWNDAVDYAAGLYDGCQSCGGTDNDCGLSDGSTAGDWRLPNVKELLTLIHYGNCEPAFPSGHPFTGVASSFYWSSTTSARDAPDSWFVDLATGAPYLGSKSENALIWPVRGGD